MDYPHDNHHHHQNDIIWQNDFEDHFISMTARERLQEFQGRIPPKKKHNNNNNHGKSDKNRSEPKTENKTKIKVSLPIIYTICLFVYFVYYLASILFGHKKCYND